MKLYIESTEYSFFFFFTQIYTQFVKLVYNKTYILTTDSVSICQLSFRTEQKIFSGIGSNLLS